MALFHVIYLLNIPLVFNVLLFYYENATTNLIIVKTSHGISYVTIEITISSDTSFLLILLPVIYYLDQYL